MLRKRLSIDMHHDKTTEQEEKINPQIPLSYKKMATGWGKLKTYCIDMQKNNQ